MTHSSQEWQQAFKTVPRTGATETILSKTSSIVNVQIRKDENRTVLISAQKYRENTFVPREKKVVQIIIRKISERPLKTAEKGGKE